MEQASTYLKTVPFTDFLLWDVKRYNYVFNSNFDNAVFLKDILKPYKERLSKEELIENNWRIIKKINFQGELFLRDKEDVESYKGSLNKVPDNSIIYSKINVRHGCIYYHKTGEEPFGVSSEYPTFIFNEDKVDGKYLMLVLRSNEFKRLLNTKASGISKARVKVDEFLGIKIPLPSLPEQNRIVSQYNQTIQLAQQQEQEANTLEEEIEKYLYSTLGISETKKVQKEGLLDTISYREVDRWAVDSLGRLAKIENKFKGYYPLIKFRELIFSTQYGLSEKSSKKKIGPPMLRMNNIYNGDLQLDDLKYITINESTYKKYRLDKGDLLFNRTNSKELVGKTALFDSDDEYTFASYLIRVVLKEDIVNKKYINYLFNSSILQFQKDLISRQITGQANINAQEMQEFLFPLPDYDMQNEIANHIDELKNQIKDLRKKANANREKALRNFEQEIFAA